jgi:hypothetical protein
MIIVIERYCIYVFKLTYGEICVLFSLVGTVIGILVIVHLWFRLECNLTKSQEQVVIYIYRSAE